jgi:hypothetical protein
MIQSNCCSGLAPATAPGGLKQIPSSTSERQRMNVPSVNVKQMTMQRVIVAPDCYPSPNAAFLSMESVLALSWQSLGLRLVSIA